MVSPAAQEALANAEVTADELELVLHRNFDHLMSCAREEQELTMEKRIKFRYDSGLVVDKAMKAVDGLLNICGGQGIFYDHPVNQPFRDIHAGRAHVANQINKCGRNWGGVMLGEPGRGFFR